MVIPIVQTAFGLLLFGHELLNLLVKLGLHVLLERLPHALAVASVQHLYSDHLVRQRTTTLLVLGLDLVVDLLLFLCEITVWQGFCGFLLIGLLDKRDWG